jgi:7-cyano-7-deazaguanine reductase
MTTQHINMTTQPTTSLETFPNPNRAIDYTIRMTLPEFTCLCPKTGQPDFATFELEYVPAEKCLELKALKLYMWSFRERGAFHEAVTNEIADAMAKACEPNFLRLTGKFNVRGGIYTNVTVERRRSGWAAQPIVRLP